MSDVAARQPGFDLVKRYGTLAFGAFGTMLDVGLMVLGTILVGLAIALLLAGFGLVDVIPENLSTVALLGSSLVIAVVGMFCLGVASEGPVGKGRRLVGYKLWEVGVGRAIAVFVVGLLAILAHGFITGLIDGLPLPIYQAVEGLRAVGVVGMTVMPILGVPLSIFMRWAPERWPGFPNLEFPSMYVVWALAAMIVLA